MTIEEDDIRDREVWTQVARQWYLKASDHSPETWKTLSPLGSSGSTGCIAAALLLLQGIISSTAFYCGQ